MKKTKAADIANEIVNVQPMPNDCLKNLYEYSKSEEQLKKEGYKPVSRMGLIWMKEDNEK